MRMLPSTRFVALIALANQPILAAGANAQVVYSLAGDWSDVANPHGVWSYNAAPGVALTNHVPDYITGQPAWAFTKFGVPGHIPFFYKALFNTSLPADLPMGRIAIHNNDPANSPLGFENAAAGVSWTAPSAGNIQISGGSWIVNRDQGRTQDWFIKVNGSTITNGVLTSDNGFNSITPLNFSTGSGGIAALSRSVLSGDVISLEFLRHAGEPFGSHMGIDLFVQFTPVPNQRVWRWSGARCSPVCSVSCGDLFSANNEARGI
jgi:hypothetical protein